MLTKGHPVLAATPGSPGLNASNVAMQRDTYASCEQRSAGTASEAKVTLSSTQRTASRTLAVSAGPLRAMFLWNSFGCLHRAASWPSAEMSFQCCFPSLQLLKSR